MRASLGQTSRQLETAGVDGAGPWNVLDRGGLSKRGDEYESGTTIPIGQVDPTGQAREVEAREAIDPLGRGDTSSRHVAQFGDAPFGAVLQSESGS